MIDLRDASLLDILPESLLTDDDAVAIAQALDFEIQEVSAAIAQALVLPNIAELTVEVCNEFGWAMRFDELQLWDDATVEGKRALLAGSLHTRKKSGTRYAVRRIFDLMQVSGELVEWFEEGAPAYTYRIRLIITGGPGITLHQFLVLSELTHRFAPTRCQLSELAVEADSTGSLLLYPALTVGRLVEVGFGGP
jgi:hypothetical protein